MGENLCYIAGAIVLIWGVGHLAPTQSIVRGFGALSKDNEKILTMEWLMEGLTLIFLGLLVIVVTYVSGPREAVSQVVYGLSAGMLIVMAVVSLLTGARTKVLPMKICPIVKITSAVLIFVGMTV